MTTNLDLTPGTTLFEKDTWVEHTLQDIIDGVAILRTKNGDAVRIGVDVLDKKFYIKGTF